MKRIDALELAINTIDELITGERELLEILYPKDAQRKAYIREMREVLRNFEEMLNEERRKANDRPV